MTSTCSQIGEIIMAYWCFISIENLWTKEIKRWEGTTLMVGANLRLLKISRRVYEVTVTLHFNFRLMLCSRQDILLKNIDQNKLEDNL